MKLKTSAGTSHSGRARGRRARLRSAALAGIVSAAAVGGALATTSPANASAYGCTRFGGAVPNVGANSTFCASVSGSGSYIDYVNGNVTKVLWWMDTVCNGQLAMDVYNRYGQYVGSRYGAVHSGCVNAGGMGLPGIPVYTQFNASGGYVNVRLLESGSTKAMIQEHLG